MAYLALYRKYRPETFDKLIGQDNIVKTLVNQIETDRLGHAYLFTGSRGTGKTSCAKIFSRAINCQNPQNGSPCGKCESCKALLDPSNIDVIEIDAASNNGVNEIRDLREKVQYPPVSCKYKVYIIDEVHMLTGAAFNALLKTLEEPPKHAVFILATTEAHKIPATILSRCMRFDFSLISTEKIAELISGIYDEIGKEYDKEAVTAIAKAGEGSIRDALSIADTALSFSQGKLSYDDVADILGTTNFDLLCEFIYSLINGETGKILTIINNLCNLGKSMGVLIKDITGTLRDMLVIKTCKKPNDILNLPEDKFNALDDIAESTSDSRLLRILEIFSDAEASLKYTNHPRIVFETAAIKSARPDVDCDFDSLVARIKTLEDKIASLSVNGGNKPLQTENKNQAIIDNFTPIEIKGAGSSKIPLFKQENLTVENFEKVTSAQSGVSRKTLQSAKDVAGGILLKNLRQKGHEMLWNLMQNVEIEVLGNILVLTTLSQGDEEILDRADNRGYIEEALEEFLPFEIQVKISENQKKKNEFDAETEKIKQIFGSDIVIIKDE